MFAPTFTIEMWLFAIVPNSMLHIQNFLTLGAIDGKISAVSSYGTYTGSNVAINEWFLLTFSNQYRESNLETTQQFGANNVIYDTTSKYSEILIDSYESVKHIGKADINYYSGYLYSITIYFTARSDFSDVGEPVTACPDGCEYCPIDKSHCLSDCAEDEVASSPCTPCLEECQFGCVRQENCNPCLQICKTCHTFLGCVDCITNAEIVGDIC